MISARSFFTDVWQWHFPPKSPREESTQGRWPWEKNVLTSNFLLVGNRSVKIQLTSYQYGRWQLMMGLNFDAEEKAKRNAGHQFQVRGVGIANTCTGINRKFLIPVALLWVTARGPESRDLGRKLSQDYDTDWIDLLEECPLYIWRYSGLSLYTGDWDRRALDRMGMIFDDSWWGTQNSNSRRFRANLHICV